MQYLSDNYPVWLLFCFPFLYRNVCPVRYIKGWDIENNNKVFEKHYINNIWQVADNSVQINRNLSDNALTDVIFQYTKVNPYRNFQQKWSPFTSGSSFKYVLSVWIEVQLSNPS